MLAKLKFLLIWKPILTTAVLVIGFYFFIEALYVQMNCNTLELDQLRHLCQSGFAPGPADDCEILPICVSNNAHTQYIRILNISAIVFWITSSIVLVKLKKYWASKTINR